MSAMLSSSAIQPSTEGVKLVLDQLRRANGPPTNSARAWGKCTSVSPGFWPGPRYITCTLRLPSVIVRMVL